MTAYVSCSPTSTRRSRSRTIRITRCEWRSSTASRVDRWRPLVHWLLILPYAIVAAILVYVAEIVAFIGVFVILFTGKLPQGMFNLIANPFRWQLRGGAYHLWMIDKYPPFEWEE